LSERSGARPRVLVAGGGVAALEAVLTLDEIAGDNLDVTLLTAGRRFEYRPLSVAEPFGLGRAHRFELRELLMERNVAMIVDALEAVDASHRRVRTSGGRTLDYEALLIAVGCGRLETLPDAITFSGSKSSTDIRRLLQSAARGEVKRLVFAVPPGVSWPLPAYELALMTSAHFFEHEIDVSTALVTPESRPVEAFGVRASDAVEEMLGLRQIAFHNAVPVRVEPGRLLVEQGDPIPADAVVALPGITAQPIPGLPGDKLGFLPIDEHGRVEGLRGVYGAGDITSFPLKQGGIAAQQADAAAEAIAADLGENVTPQPLRPVLRGLLLAGRAPRYLRTEVVSDRATRSVAEKEAIPWPPAKVAGRRLGPFLARHGVPGNTPPGAVALELEAPVVEPGGRVSS